MTTAIYPGDADWPANVGGGTVTGSFVDITAEPVSGTVDFEPTAQAGTGLQLVQIPDGFKCRFVMYLPPAYPGGGSFIYTPEGFILVYYAGDLPPSRATWSWFTDEAWPSTLPGVAL